MVRGSQDKAAGGGSHDSDHQLKITLYSNGFVVDEGEFRPYDAPENKQFMKELNEVYVPKEIQQKYKKNVGVALEDKRQEAYTPPPPPKYVAYSGQGASIG